MTLAGAETRKSIVVLACHGYEQHALINRLSADNEMVGIVFEDRRRTLIRVLANRLRRLGLITVLDQLVYKVFDELFFKPKAGARVKQLLGENAFFRKSNVPGTIVVETLEVNSSETIDIMKAINPDVVVVSGVSILREELLDAIGHVPVLNLHCGITPRYRGSHGAFWAVVNNDWENAGTTVHFIDRGVDTGPIVSQQTIDLESADDPRSLALKQNLAGIELTARAIEQIASGDIRTLERPDLDSRFYSSPTFTAYLRFRANLKKRFIGESP